MVSPLRQNTAVVLGFANVNQVWRHAVERVMLNYSLGLGTTIQFNYATKEIREFLYRNYEGYCHLDMVWRGLTF